MGKLTHLLNKLKKLKFGLRDMLKLKEAAKANIMSSFDMNCKLFFCNLGMLSWCTCKVLSYISLTLALGRQ